MAEKLITGDRVSGGDGSRGREMCDELLAWLRAERRQRLSSTLMKRIDEAHRNGDTGLLMELLRQKQEMGQK